MVSDLVLGLISIVFFIFIVKRSFNWSMFFLVMGVSAIFGGIWHGFFTETNNSFRYLSWTFLTASILFPAFELYKNLKNIFNLGFVIISSVLLFLAIHYSDFVYMEINAIIIMLGFVFFKSIVNSKQNKNYLLINLGIFISLVSVFFQIKKYSFSEYFDYNDIGHYITALSLLVIFIGVRKLLKS